MREAFEKWLSDYDDANLISDDIIQGWIFDAWQACELEQAKRATIHTNNDQTFLNALDTIKRLTDQNKELVEALEAISGATQLTNPSWTKKKLLTLIRGYANEALAKAK